MNDGHPAVARLYRQVSRAALGSLRKKGVPPEDAVDLLHDTFTALLKYPPPQYEPGAVMFRLNQQFSRYVRACSRRRTFEQIMKVEP